MGKRRKALTPATLRRKLREVSAQLSEAEARWATEHRLVETLSGQVNNGTARLAHLSTRIELVLERALADGELSTATRRRLLKETGISLTKPRKKKAH